MVSQTRYGILFYLLWAGIIAIAILTYYRQPSEPETRVSAYLEGRVYSNNSDGTTRVWDVRDTQIHTYPEEQIFVPTVIRIVENQAQGRWPDPTVSWTGIADCLEAMNYLYSTRGSDQDITSIYGAAEWSDENFCMLYQWCPAFYNETYTEHILNGVRDQNIIIKGQIRDEEGDLKSKFQLYIIHRWWNWPESILPWLKSKCL